jgi:cytochrome c2
MSARLCAAGCLCGLAAAIAVAAGCGAGGSSEASAAFPGSSAAAGHNAIEAVGCGACHRIGGVQGANGQVGPSLIGIAQRQYIAGGRLTTTPDNLVRWIRDPQAVLPGTAMPNLGIGEGTARNIVAYLYSQ